LFIIEFSIISAKKSLTKIALNASALAASKECQASADLDAVLSTIDKVRKHDAEALFTTD
jgi:hypothetical protein